MKYYSSWWQAQGKSTDIFCYTFSFQLVKQAILPRVHGLALKTTVAAVSILCNFDLLT